MLVCIATIHTNRYIQTHTHTHTLARSLCFTHTDAHTVAHTDTHRHTQTHREREREKYTQTNHKQEAFQIHIGTTAPVLSNKTRPQSHPRPPYEAKAKSNHYSASMLSCCKATSMLHHSHGTHLPSSIQRLPEFGQSVWGARHTKGTQQQHRPNEESSLVLFTQTKHYYMSLYRHGH